MNRVELRALRELARELALPASVIDTALECGLFEPDESFESRARVLRRMRRLMHDLGVNAPGAALLVRMCRDLEGLQVEVTHLRRVQARRYENWRDAHWRDTGGASD
jgi:hypothetical protein